jgi:hypothetical protein
VPIGDQQAERRLAPWIDRGVKLGLDLSVQGLRRGDSGVPDLRESAHGAPAGSPVQLAERESAQPRGRPWTHVEKARGRHADSIGRDPAVELHDEERIVAPPGALPWGVHRHQHEVGAAEGEAMRAEAG